MTETTPSAVKLKLSLWEIGTVLWVCIAGSVLHFAFELSDYWRPMAVIAAVNESAWEHTKMYFWPGLLAALVQFTYTRNVAHNYWLGKSAALSITPCLIWLTYFSYMSWVVSSGGKASLPTMLLIMVLGIGIGQATSGYLLTRPLSLLRRGYATGAIGIMAAVFATASFFPPEFFSSKISSVTNTRGVWDFGKLRPLPGLRQSKRERRAGGWRRCELLRRPPNSLARGQPSHHSLTPLHAAGQKTSF